MYLANRFTVDPWSALRDMERWVDDLHRTFHLPAAAGRSCAVNVWADDASAHIQAELPGVNPDDVAISVVGDDVTIAERKSKDNEADYVWSRSIHLPFVVDADQTEAQFSNGILQIRLPRPAHAAPKTITVKAE